MNLTDLFDASLRGRSARVALDLRGPADNWTSLTFGDIESRANRMAHELAARGLERGDRLAIHLPNGIAFLDLFLACTRLGVILVPMNTQYRERELGHIVRDSEPKAIVVESGSSLVYPDGFAKWTAEELVAAASTRSPERVVVDVTGEMPALIIYTSGTTGAAKGAVLSHNALAANGKNVTTSWRIGETDRYLAVLPLFHVHGLGNGVHAWLISGCLMRLVERFDHREAAQLFAEFRPTLFFGVPTIYVRMLDESVMSHNAARVTGGNARLFVSGSAPLPAHVLEEFRRRYGHAILERYGMTEALMLMTNPYDGERRPGSVGKPFPGVDVRLLGDEGEPSDGVKAERGEVLVKSPHLFSGYWRNEQATAAAFSEGYLRTGDMAERSPDGYYALRGRKGDLIISGGYNIYPREIEELILEDSCVKEAAVVGVPHTLLGEVPVAYVVVDGEFDAARLEERCRGQLASFKVPRAFVQLESLPRTALGKVQKHLLPDPQ